MVMFLAFKNKKNVNTFNRITKIDHLKSVIITYF